MSYSVLHRIVVCYGKVWQLMIPLLACHNTA